MNKKVIIIAGPTASGKSQMAIDVALQHNGEIINCDSQQLYKDTPIISACPNEEDKKTINHHLYQIYDSNTHGNVVNWLNLCVEKIKKLWAENKTPVIVGGTGLYINNLIYGTTPIPAISQEIKKQVDKISNPYDKLDEGAKKALNPNDSTRVKRALEVLLQTKKSIVEWHKKPLIKAIEADFFVIKILPEKQSLDNRIDTRFDAMIKNGAIEEAKHFMSLNIANNMPAAKALGLPELIGYLRNETTLNDAIELSKTHSRQYAKRQITWFKNKLDADYILNDCYTKMPEDLSNLINS